MFHLISIIICGFIVGALAKLVMPGKDGGGILATAILGIVGSLVGTIIGRAVFHTHGHYVAGWMMSILGAIAVLAIYHFITRSWRSAAITG